MLFALVPLNNLSSSFTRIDGTVFDGSPGKQSLGANLKTRLAQDAAKSE